MKYKHMKFLSSIILKNAVLCLLLMVFVQHFVIVHKDMFNIHDLLGEGIWGSGLLNTSYERGATPDFIKMIVISSIFFVQYCFTLVFVGNILDFGKNMILYHSSHKYDFFLKLLRSVLPTYFFETIINLLVIISFYILHNSSDKNFEILLNYIMTIGSYILAITLYFILIMITLKNSLFMFCAIFIIIIFQKLLFTSEMVLALLVFIGISFSKIGNYFRVDEV